MNWKHRERGGGSFRVEEIEGRTQLVLYEKSTSRGRYNREVARNIASTYEAKTRIRVLLE